MSRKPWTEFLRLCHFILAGHRSSLDQCRWWANSCVTITRFMWNRFVTYQRGFPSHCELKISLGILTFYFPPGLWKQSPWKFPCTRSSLDNKWLIWCCTADNFLKCSSWLVCSFKCGSQKGRTLWRTCLCSFRIDFGKLNFEDNLSLRFSWN